ncbi:MAG: peptide ABC transporter substrate-binding protein [Chloroflexi bacterium]|nr:peptide ABC transporter substrate-binding protein [Chloroflexota bacterium]
MSDWIDAPSAADDERAHPTGPRLRWQLILLGVGLVLIALAGLFFLLGGQPEETPPDIAAADEQVYREAVVGQPQFVNPLLATTQADRDLSALVFSGLTRLDAYGQPVPDLAESWEVSRDGLTITFRLRPDATWHDGEPVTAEDAAFTFALLRDPDFPGPPERAAFWRTVEVYADDERTVRFVLTQPLSAFPEYAGIGLLPEHWLAGVDAAGLTEDPFNLDPIGSGRLDWMGISQEGGVTSVHLAPYAGYYDDERAVGLEAVYLDFYQDGARAFAALGPDAQGLGGLTESQREAVFDSPQLNVYMARMPAFGAVIFNQQSSDVSFFQQEEVRTALLVGLDRTALLREAGGAAVLADSPILPGMWAYNAQLPALVQDADLAASQLEQAGETLSFTLLALDDPFTDRLARGIRDQWRDLGVDVDVRTVDAETLIERLQDGDFDAALVEFNQGGIADPDPYAFWHESQIEAGQNVSGFVDRDISEVIEIARRDPNGVRRAELYRDFQRYFIERGAAIPLYNPVYTYAVSCQVEGVQLHLLTGPADRFRSLHMWRIAEGLECGP